ncbi:WD domain protein [Viridothelium virens]|uniref:WD domain protein n=1 Tax=Viridothelium virens TaxID=1048519 RepID=A0A6A6H2Y7_VIRVR|nr:WD domain protein [Viridothelium virens]
MRPEHDPSKNITPSRPFSHRSSNGSSNGTTIPPSMKTSPSSHTNGSHEKSESNGYTNGVGRPTGSFFGHDREEVTRILIQSLQDLGYQAAAQQLSRESGHELEGPAVAAFRNAVLQGEWTEAEAFLLGSVEQNQGAVSHGTRAIDHGISNSRGSLSNNSGSREGQLDGQLSGLVLSETATRNELLFLMRQQKYLELLENRDLGAALMVLRQELTPYSSNTSRLHALSSLMMCESAADLRIQAKWDGSDGQSRSQLLSDLSRSISPSVMIPEHRLAVLLQRVKDNQIAECKYHNTADSPSLYLDHTCSRDEFPLVTGRILQGQQDEIWGLQFSHDGTMLATASKDSTVLIYETVNFKTVHSLADHSEGGITYVAWSPDDSKVVSCGQDKSARVWDTQTGNCLLDLTDFTDPVTTAVWTPNGQNIILGSLTPELPISIWNLKGERIYKWEEENRSSKIRVHDIALSPDGNRLVAITSDDRIFIYDYWSRNQLAQWSMGTRMTCINISSDGRHVLVNMKDDRVVMLDIDTGETVQTFPGQKQSTFMIRSCFGGAGEELIASGSEDSKVYIWRRRSGELIEKLEGHEKPSGPESTSFVNAIAWHPHDPSIFASAGDDHTVRMYVTKALQGGHRQGPLAKTPLC